MCRSDPGHAVLLMMLVQRNQPREIRARFNKATVVRDLVVKKKNSSRLNTLEPEIVQQLKLIILENILKEKPNQFQNN